MKYMEIVHYKEVVAVMELKC